MKYGYFESINPAYNPIKQLHPNSKFKPSPLPDFEGLLWLTSTNQTFESSTDPVQYRLVLDTGKLWCYSSSPVEHPSLLICLQLCRVVFPEVGSGNNRPSAGDCSDELEHAFALVWQQSHMKFMSLKLKDKDKVKLHQALTKHAIRIDIASRFRFKKLVRSEEDLKAYLAIELQSQSHWRIYAYEKKALNTKIKDKLTLLNEITVSRTLDHPNILVAKVRQQAHTHQQHRHYQHHDRNTERHRVP